MLSSETRSSIRIAAIATVALGCGNGQGADAAFAALPHWTIVPEQVIGSLDGGIAFGIVSTVRIGPDSNVYVVESTRPDIQVFSPSGAPLRVIGRGGQGPGEFARPERIGWLNRELWVSDFSARRITWFDSVGRVVKAVTVSLTGGPVGLASDVAAPLADGNLVTSPAATAGALASGNFAQIPALLITQSGNVLDTLYFTDARHQQWGMRNGTRAFYTLQPFDDAPIDLFQAPEETVVHISWIETPKPSISVTRRTRRHELIFDVAIPFRPIPVTDAMIGTWVNRIAFGFRSSNPSLTDAEARRIARSGLYVPPHLRPVTTAMSAPGGGVWLSLAADAGRRAQRDSVGARWLVLAADGKVFGVVDVPRRFALQVPGESELWGVQRDSLDVNYVVRARLVRSGKE